MQFFSRGATPKSKPSGQPTNEEAGARAGQAVARDGKVKFTPPAEAPKAPSVKSQATTPSKVPAAKPVVGAQAAPGVRPAAIAARQVGASGRPIGAQVGHTGIAAQPHPSQVLSRKQKPSS